MSSLGRLREPSTRFARIPRASVRYMANTVAVWCAGSRTRSSIVRPAPKSWLLPCSIIAGRLPHGAGAPPNKRLKLPARVLGNESFFSAPQLKRGPLDGGTPILSQRMLSSTACFVAIATLSGCPPPGEGSKAQAGYQRAAPVLTALAAYHAEHHNYPDSLVQLMPGLARSTLLAAAVEYRHAGDDFELSFRYFGPGVNDCTYRGSERKWSCSGHF